MSAGTPSHLRVEAIACRRGGRQLFTELSFELRAGEVQQVVGPNGSGKTTLLRILCGLRAPDAGRVLWQERPIEEADDDYRAALAYLGFHSGLKLELTAQENLEFARALAASIRVSPAEALAQARLEAYAQMPCQQLSTGQRRRVALARLLMLGASLWILDEPLTGLDQASRADFEQALFAHAGAGGMAILTTHHPLGGPRGKLRLLDLGQ